MLQCKSSSIFSKRHSLLRLLSIISSLSSRARASRGGTRKPHCRRAAIQESPDVLCRHTAYRKPVPRAQSCRTAPSRCWERQEREPAGTVRLNENGPGIPGIQLAPMHQPSRNRPQSRQQFTTTANRSRRSGIRPRNRRNASNRMSGPLTGASAPTKRIIGWPSWGAGATLRSRDQFQVGCIHIVPGRHPHRLEQCCCLGRGIDQQHSSPTTALADDTGTE